METTLLRVRLIQLRHELRLLGPLHWLLFATLFALAVSTVFQLFSAKPACFYVGGGVVLAAWGYHYARPDRPFVQLHLSRPWLSLFTEYAVLSLPFTAPALLTPHWYCFFLSLAGLGGVAALRPKKQKSLSRLSPVSWLPAGNFEWIGGMRQAFPFLALLYAAALAFCWVKVLPVFLLWLFATAVTSFYQECEPLQMLHAQGRSARSLLHTKLRRHTLLLGLLFLPVVALSALFQPELAPYYLAYLVLQLVCLCFAILLKYSSYSPGARLSGNSLLLGFAQLSLVLPFLLLVPPVLCLRHYRLAIRNLSHYFHD